MTSVWSYTAGIDKHFFISFLRKRKIADWNSTKTLARPITRIGWRAYCLPDILLQQQDRFARTGGAKFLRSSCAIMVWYSAWSKQNIIISIILDQWSKRIWLICVALGSANPFQLLQNDACNVYWTLCSAPRIIIMWTVDCESGPRGSKASDNPHNGTDTR